MQARGAHDLLSGDKKLDDDLGRRGGGIMPRALLPEGEILPKGKGWTGLPPVRLDGDNWTIQFAAKMLDMTEQDVRDIIRITGLEPSGTMRMASYARQGRQPRAYPAEKLVKIAEALRTLREQLGIR